MRRVILLGASNLTLGFPLIVESLQASVHQVELFAAHGHGRSYGRWSRVLSRRLPGIRDCGLWDALQQRPDSETRPLALMTDVGNDLLYGHCPDAILGWAAECLERLRAQSAAITITGVPLESLKRMSSPRYHATRMCFFPRRGVGWATMKGMIEELDEGLRALSLRYGAAFVEPQRGWYGVDPIHVRRSRRSAAWRQILQSWPVEPLTIRGSSPQRALRLWSLRPHLRQIAGRRQTTPQPVHREPDLLISVY
jgi:hypothetical protein